MTHTKSLEDFIFKCIGGLSVMVCISSMIPQIYKMHKTKRTNDLSITGYYINFVGITLIEVYSFYFNLWEIFIPNVLSWLLIVLQIILKKCYDTDHGILDDQLIIDDINFNKPVSVSPLSVNISPMNGGSDMDVESEYEPFRTGAYSSPRARSLPRL